MILCIIAFEHLFIGKDNVNKSAGSQWVNKHLGPAIKLIKDWLNDFEFFLVVAIVLKSAIILFLVILLGFRNRTYYTVKVF